MVIRLILCMCVLYCFTACSSQVPLRVRKNFTFCYDSIINYSNSIARLDGYYVKAKPFERIQYDWKTGNKVGAIKDTIYSNIMFFNDGVFVKEFQQLICNNCKGVEDKTSYLKSLENNEHSKTDLFYNGFKWGIYRVEGDIIKTQSVNRQSWPNPYWYLVEVWYKISDDRLIEIYSKDLIDDEELVIKVDNIPFDFIETGLILPSNTWLKKEKWFWCDEEQYKEWKTNRLK